VTTQELITEIDAHDRETNPIEGDFCRVMLIDEPEPDETEEKNNFIGSATYSPEDNKIRIYPFARLSKEDYQRVKSAGFIWAPKQELFVAPAWSPAREDFAREMCGEIDDEDTTLVERAEAKAERLENLSERKQQQADSARRAVSSIAENIPFGQPILVGHHSERHARKDAERIENGMRKAVECWKAAGYWQERAKGALRLAKYKERPDVRARRIKGIEAEYRKCDKTQGECLSELKAWSITPMTWKLAKMISGRTRHGFSRCYPLAEYPRPEGASQYVGEMSLYSTLGDAPETGIITPDQAQETATKSLRGHVEVMRRWIDHLQHRLDYERAMLYESGGLVAEQHEIKVGGRVLVGGEWVVVLRVNRKDGKACSFRTARRYVPVVGAEEVRGYEPPSEEEAATVAEAMKKGPMCNYPGERFATCTQAEWDAIYKDHRGSEVIAATETTGTHRVRKAIGFKLHLPAPTGKELEPGYCNANRTYHYWPVYITDAKRKDPPAKVPESAPAPTVDLFQNRIDAEELEARTARLKAANAARDTREAAAAPFEALAEQMKAGVKVAVVPQLFPTPPELAARMAGEADIQPSSRILEPSAGTGNLIRAIANDTTGFDCLREITAVEYNHALVAHLIEQRERTLYANENNFKIVCGDFMEQNDNLGMFDRIVMNPPFQNGADIKHIQHAAKFLADGGRLVALCANGPRQREILKPIAEESGGWWEDLPAGTFKEQGTGVNVALLLICNG
jgi:protein-L-isoaspartate O-methyltransferase